MTLKPCAPTVGSVMTPQGPRYYVNCDCRLAHRRRAERYKSRSEVAGMASRHRDYSRRMAESGRQP